MPPFKDELGPDAGRRLATEIAKAWPEFPRGRFVRGLGQALEPLELLARSAELTTRLRHTLPASFAEAAPVLYGALASSTFAGWIVLPVGGFVAEAGIDEPATALPLLAALTPRWSSEFAIRPFIERHPELTYDRLAAWATHEDHHVRRLVSEGTRPRLPWARQLPALVADPTPNIALLEALVEDSSAYVRRSVANHLNDISRDHPDVAVELAERWASRGTDAAWVVRHGLRGLVKRGDPRALELVGATVEGDVELRHIAVEPRRITIGDSVTISLTLGLATTANESVGAIIDYRVHYVGARGTAKAPKVFKLTRRRIEPGETVAIDRRHRFEHASIRQLHPGTHVIDVQVNGRVLGTTSVDLAP